MSTIDPAVLRRYRRKRLLRRVVGIVTVTLLTLALIEVLLRITDPFGAAYFGDLSGNFYDQAIEDPRGYVIPAGAYQASHWSFTILPDHTRAVPDTTTDSERTMVFIGDSVTFGYGVEDAETFVNLVAQAFPDWRVINDSYPGWNIQNLEGAWSQHPDADLIFVLTITNDLTEPYVTPAFNGWRPLYIQAYATWIGWIFTGFPTASAEQIAAREPGWLESIRAIASDPRTTLLTIDTAGDYEQRVAAMFPDKTEILENFTGLVSTVDSHPNPASHIFLADQIIPIVASRIAALNAD